MANFSRLPYFDGEVEKDNLNASQFALEMVEGFSLIGFKLSRQN